MQTALIVTACVVFLLLLPCVTVTLLLFGRKEIRDFDEIPDRIRKGEYAPYAERILDSIAALRSLRPETVETAADDGTVLRAEWFDRGAERTAILVHGFCSTPYNNFAVQIRDLIERGFNVLAVWQRGHCKSGGRFTTLGIAEANDVLNWVEWAGSRPGGSNIVLYGLSMGGASVAYASDRFAPGSVRAMVLDCCYPSPYSQMFSGKGAKALIWAPIMPLVWLLSKLIVGVDIKSSTEGALSRTNVPAFFICGLADKKVSVKEFMKSYDACASEKELLAVPDAPHALAYSAADAAQIESLYNFIDKYLSDHQGGKHEY